MPRGKGIFPNRITPEQRPLRVRFEEKYVQIPHCGCWIWTASTSAGYGQLWHRDHGRAIGAHRIAYELYRGEIPAGFDIDHLCRTPSCVNPDHLEAVTHRENVMRGESPGARAQRRTHCSEGHVLSGENLYVEPSGCRRCRICRRVALSNSRRNK